MEEINISEVYKAAEVLRDVARHPKLIGPTALNPDAEIYLKPENLQRTGSFKLRGAYYKISQLDDEERSRGVIACSAGNHAQGVALGAAHAGIKATICLERPSLKSKLQERSVLRLSWSQVSMTTLTQRLSNYRRNTVTLWSIRLMMSR